MPANLVHNHNYTYDKWIRVDSKRREEIMRTPFYISFTILLDAKEQVSTEIHTMYPVERYTPIPHDL